MTPVSRSHPIPPSNGHFPQRLRGLVLVTISGAKAAGLNRVLWTAPGGSRTTRMKLIDG